MLTDEKGRGTMGKRSQTTDRSFQHAEIYICWKTEYGYDDEHGHDDVHAFCDVHKLLAIVLRCFETNLILTNGSEDASRFFIALWLALRGKTQRR